MDLQFRSEPEFTVNNESDLNWNPSTSAISVGVVPGPAHGHSQTINNHICGGMGGAGGASYAQGIGGHGGLGEGPTLNYTITGSQFTVNNNIDMSLGSISINPQSYSEPEFTLVSPSDGYGSAAYAEGFWPGVSGFTLRGGTFNGNVTNNVFHPPPQEQPSAFRTIPLGDIKLIKEIRFKLCCQCGAVVRQRRGSGVRRMYSAKLERETGRAVTVAMYQGSGAEEEWQQHVAKYQWIRHPNIMQLYGLVRTGGLHAMVFHDELIPLRQFLDRFQHSPVLTTYILGYCAVERDDAADYIESAFDTQEPMFDSSLLWIYPATGSLCVDVVQARETDSHSFELPSLGYIERVEDLSLDEPHAESIVISNLDEEEYHKTCSEFPLLSDPWSLFISTQLPVPSQLWPTIFHLNSEDRATRIVQLLGFDHENPVRWDGGKGPQGEVLANFWTRYDSSRVPDLSINMYNYDLPHFWLAQANYVFTQLQETSHLEDYVCVHQISFVLRCLPNTSSVRAPDGYLFVCPVENFRTGPDLFRWPDCPAFWSLDPAGTSRLSSEHARILGFPLIHIETTLWGQSWDTKVYDGLRQLHQGKGFDPDSQEVAIDLGYPLYELLPDVDVCSESIVLRCERCNLKDGEVCRELGHYL